MDAVVRLDHAWRRFGPVVAVADVSFEVVPGEVFGLLGHNGAGKTTLLRMVNGLLPADAGSVHTLGLDPLTQGNRVRRRTGVLTTYPALDEYLSPAENLSVYAAIHGLSPAAGRARLTQLLDRLGLDPTAREPSRGLSAGLKQRVALARALIHDPELLLLDEPTANLDPLAARGVRDLVSELAGEGKTVIFSTHNLAEAEQLCDRVAILRHGHMVALGSLDQLSHGRLQAGLAIVVEDGQQERALRALADVAPDHPVAVAGAELFVTGVAHHTVPHLLKALVLADVSVHAAHPRLPSLEDVYLAVHEQGVPG